MPDDYSHVDPEHKLIYRFVRTLFSAAQLTAECAIVTLVSLVVYHALVFTPNLLTPVYLLNEDTIIGILEISEELKTGLVECK